MRLKQPTARMRHTYAGAIGALALLGLMADPALAQKRGGDLVMAQQAQPPTLDAMTSSAQASRNITLHIFETLFARDEAGTPIPDLATKVDISADGKTYVFPLRQGVKFHNGKVMTSADVKASLERYAKVGGSAAIMKPVEAIETPDANTVVLKLANPVPGFIAQLSSPRAPAVIIPAEEAAKAANQISFIGTGPFEFVEFLPDSHVKLKRFEGYSQNMNFAARDGFGGRKTAWVDTITIKFMPEGGARTAALQAGEAQVLEALPAPDAKRFQANRQIKIYEMLPWAYQTLMFNASAGPAANVDFRRAVLAAIDPEEIMAISTDGNFRLTHGWQHPNTTYFAGDIGKDRYGQKNAAKAKEFLTKAGYKGEPFVIMADTAFKNHNDTAVVLSQQLKAVGINVQLQVSDWPTAFNNAKKADAGWNGWTLMLGIEPYEGPYGVVGVFAGKQGFMHVIDDEMEKINARLNNSLAETDRQAAVRDFQERMYDQVWALKIGDVGIYQATRANIANYKPYRIPRMWDVWIE